VEGDLNKVNGELNRAKQDCDDAEARLNELSSKNDAAQNQDWESKLKGLQSDLDQKEKIREGTQGQADKAMAEMGAKLNVFKDPYMDRATEMDDLMGKIRGLNGGDSTAAGSEAGDGSSHDADSDRNRRAGDSALGNRLGGRKDHLDDLMGMSGDLKAKADLMNDLRRKRDDLEGRRMKR